MSILAARIRQLREKKALSQEQLAHEVDTSQRQISKYETGRNEPTAHVLDLLANALDTTTDYLLGRTDIPDRPMRNYDDLSKNERAVIRALRQREPLEAIRIITEDGSEFRVRVHEPVQNDESE